MHDEPSGRWQMREQTEFERDYRVELWVGPASTEVEVAARGMNVERPDVLPGLLAKGPLGINFIVEKPSPVKGRWVGLCRFTRFGPDWIEGHFACDVEWDIRDDDSKARSCAKWRLEYCFRASRKVGQGEETSGALKKRLDEGERTKRAELKAKTDADDKVAKAALDVEKAELKKRQEAYKADPKNLDALQKFQEQAAKVEKVEREYRDARRDAQKRIDSELRAWRLEACEAAWKGYFEKAPKEVGP
jgi:hypothetical protein